MVFDWLMVWDASDIGYSDATVTETNYGRPSYYLIQLVHFIYLFCGRPMHFEIRIVVCKTLKS